MSGAELAVTITGPSSGIVRSNLGSRPRNVNFAGIMDRNSSTTFRGNLTISVFESTMQPCLVKIERAFSFLTSKPTVSRISREAWCVRSTCSCVRSSANVDNGIPPNDYLLAGIASFSVSTFAARALISSSGNISRPARVTLREAAAVAKRLDFSRLQPCNCPYINPAE